MQSDTSRLRVTALALVLVFFCTSAGTAAGWSSPAGLQLPPFGVGNATASNGTSILNLGAASSPVTTVALEPPDPDDYAAMAEYLVESTKADFSGAAVGSPAITVSTFDVITDADLADPAYLGRSQAVKVDVVTNASDDTLAASLWGQEVDATRIAEAFYSGDLEGKTAFVAVFFRPTSSGDYSSKFILNAKDASCFGDTWDGSSYIRFEDWSAAVVRGSGVSYEDPETAMVPLQEISTEEQVPCDHEILKSAASEATGSIASIVSQMTISADGQDYTTVANLADDLTGEARSYAEAFRAYAVPDDLEDVREQFVDAFDSYGRAGSAIWYGAAFTDSDKIDLGNAYLSDGQESLNSALQGLNLRTIEDSTLTLSNTELYPDALDLGKPYKFLDKKEVNKISIRPESYVTWRTFSAGTGENLKDYRASYGMQYLFVLMDVTHIGYYGGGSSTYRTPGPTSYVLMAGGKEYKPSQPSGYMRGIGSVYASESIDKDDFSSGYLVFEIPDSIDPADAYLKLSLSGIGTPIWKLS